MFSIVFRLASSCDDAEFVRQLTHVRPHLVIIACVVMILGLLLLEHRHPNRGFESALGIAVVVVPVAITLYFLVARDWREQLNSSDRD